MTLQKGGGRALAHGGIGSGAAAGHRKLHHSHHWPLQVGFVYILRGVEKAPFCGGELERCKQYPLGQARVSMVTNPLGTWQVTLTEMSLEVCVHTSRRFLSSAVEGAVCRGVRQGSARVPGMWVCRLELCSCRSSVQCLPHLSQMPALCFEGYLR